MDFGGTMWRMRTATITVSILIGLQACGGGGGSEPAAVPDPGNPGPTLPSNTRIVEKPTSVTNQSEATFRFESNVASNTYQVRVDSGEFSPAPNPYTLTGVAEGSHTIQARAVDGQNNVDPVPDSFTWSVDMTAPVLAITNAPAARTTATQASFEFTAIDASVTEMSLDDAAYVPVSSPYVKDGLAVGQHKLTLRVSDSAGNTGEATHTWEVISPTLSDTQAPDTIISSTLTTPTRETRAEIRFSSNEPNVIFEGRLDGSHFSTVTSPHVLTNLSDGDHTFEVRAVDAAANVDATPEVIRWKVDTTAPDTTLTRTPDALSNRPIATFEFTASEPNSIFFARIDGGQLARATSPLTIRNLAEGAHTIEIAAEDALGNRDASAATFSWKIDSSEPVVQIVFPPNEALTDAGQITLVGKASDPAGIESVRVNSNASVAVTTDGYANWRAQISLVPGANTLAIEAIDINGRASATESVVIRRSDNLLSNVTGITFDGANNSLLAIDDNRLVSVDLTTGIRKIVSGGTVGSGTAFETLQGMAVDGFAKQAWVVDQALKTLFKVDMTTGFRDPVIDTTGLSTISWETPYGLAFDLETRLGYVGDRQQNLIIEVDLNSGPGTQSGARKLVSGAGRGTGPEFITLKDLVFDSTQNRLLATDSTALNRIFAIDLATGNRSEMSGPTQGNGPTFAARSMAIDIARRRLIITDLDSQGLLAIDLASGDRLPLTNGTSTSLLRSPDSVAVDADPTRNSIFVADSYRHTIIKVNGETGIQEPASDDVTGSGPIFATVEDLGVADNDVFLLEAEPFRIIRYAKDTGVRSIAISNPNTGTTSLVKASRLALDSQNGRAFVIGVPANQSQFGIFSYSLMNGARRTVLDQISRLSPDYPDIVNASSFHYDTGSDRLFAFVPFVYDVPNVLYMDSLWSINPSNAAFRQIGSVNPSIRLTADATAGAIDPDRGFIYAHDSSTGRILRINTATGVSELAADLVAGSPAIPVPDEELAFDPTTNRAYVNDIVSNAVFEVIINGPQSGARTGVSSASRGTGPLGQTFTGLTANNGVIWYFDQKRSALMAIDPVSGDRVIASR